MSLCISVRSEALILDNTPQLVLGFKRPVNRVGTKHLSDRLVHVIFFRGKAFISDKCITDWTVCVIRRKLLISDNTSQTEWYVLFVRIKSLMLVGALSPFNHKGFYQGLRRLS